jgi:magnesium chelatase family protein
MLARLKTYTLLGIEAMPVDVEVDISPAAMPKTILVGLPDTAVKESTHRVERAIVNSGFTRPHDRVVINLAPGDLPKQAASFDLPVAMGVLAGSGQLIPDRLDHYAIIGELALEGHTRPVKGGLSIAIEAAKDEGLRGIVLPAENAGEAAVVEGLDVIPVESLSQAVGFFAGEIDIAPAPSRLEQLFNEYSAYDVDFGDVRGQESAKRAVTLAAAGRHNLIMVGPPGSGEPEGIEKPPPR